MKNNYLEIKDICKYIGKFEKYKVTIGCYTTLKDNLSTTKGMSNIMIKNNTIQYIPDNELSNGMFGELSELKKIIEIIKKENEIKREIELEKNKLRKEEDKKEIEDKYELTFYDIKNDFSFKITRFLINHNTKMFIFI